MNARESSQRQLHRGLDTLADDEVVEIYDGPDDPLFAMAVAFQKQLIREGPDRARAEVAKDTSSEFAHLVSRVLGQQSHVVA